MTPMDNDAEAAKRLIDLPEDTRKFLAGLRDDELKKVKYIVEEMSIDDLQTIHDSIETLRVVKRGGRFGLWMFGFIASAASAATAIKFFVWGSGK